MAAFLGLNMSLMRLVPFRPFLKRNGKVAVLMGIGDYVAQKYVEDEDWDVSRTVKFMCVGLLFIGPSLNKWYGVLDAVIPPEKNRVKRGVKKMIIDQCIFCPLFSLILMGVFGAVNNDDGEKLKARYTQDYPDVMRLNYMIWPAVQIINFSLIPHSFQVTFVQIAAIFWNVILAQIVNKKE